MKPGLSFRHVEAFRSVMITGSVVGAARLMNVTQPGVSRTLALLELRLGYPLFERRGRRLVPTPEAEALFREVEQVQASLDRINNVAQDLRFQRAGALRVATLPALAQWLVPRTIARFQATRPEVTVFIQSLPSRQIAELVSTRQFDIGVAELPLARPAIAIEAMPPVRMVAVIPRAHPLATRREVSLRDLDGERMVLLSQHSYVRFQIDEAFSAAGVAPNVVIETPSSSIACALVAAGAGIALVGCWTAVPFEGPDLVVRPLREELNSRYGLIFPQMAPRLALADAFARELRETLAAADASVKSVSDPAEASGSKDPSPSRARRPGVPPASAKRARGAQR